MEFSRDELRVLWTAITQFVDNTEEAVDIANDPTYRDNSPEANNMREELEIAKGIRERLDYIFGAYMIIEEIKKHEQRDPVE